MSDIHKKNRPDFLIDQENPYYKKLSKEKLTDDIRNIIEHEYGSYLGKVFTREELINKFNRVIDNWEAEHTQSLTLLFEYEAQKLLLDDLNRKLTETAVIHSKDLAMAETIQRNLIHKYLPEINDFQYAHIYEPYASVSGDFYDFYVDDKNNLSGLLVADVSGHGIASGLLTILAKPIFFRVFNSHRHRPLKEVIGVINERLIREMKGADNYLTGALLRFNGSGVDYINAAHPDIILKTGTRAAIVKPAESQIQGTFLGLASLNFPYESHRFEMSAGDHLIVYTDCLTESRNPAGEEFGIERLLETVRALPQDSHPRDSLDHILRAFKDFVGKERLRDDLTLIILKKTM